MRHEVLPASAAPFQSATRARSRRRPPRLPCSCGNAAPSRWPPGRAAARGHCSPPHPAWRPPAVAAPGRAGLRFASSALPQVKRYNLCLSEVSWVSHTPAVSTPRAMIVCNCLHPNGRDPCSTNSFIILHLIPSKVWCQPDLIFLQIVSFSSLDVFRFLSVSDVLRFYYV